MRYAVPQLQPKFIKPFSKGQITLPKDYRDYFDLDENSWLKISLLNEQILIQPVEETKKLRQKKPRLTRKKYLAVLLKIKGGWLDDKEMSKTRKAIAKRLVNNEKSLN